MKKTKTAILAGWIALAFASTSAQSSAVIDTAIVPDTPFNWSTGADGLYLTADDFNNQWGQIDLRAGGSATVTKDFPHNGNGSLKLASNGGTNAKAGVAYYPPSQAGFGPLSSITTASFDWMRAAGSASADNSPVMRLYLFDPGTNNHRATLLWIASNDGVTVTDGAWQTTSLLTGKVWDTKVNGPITAFTALQADPVYSSLIVRAVEVGFGSSGWSPSFVGAVDNVQLVGGVTSVDSNFESSTVTLTMNAGPNGSASIANGAQSVNVGTTLPITLAPATGFVVDQVNGCGGSLQGNVFTTAAFSIDCAVSATFKAAPVVVVPPPAQDATAVPTLSEWALALLGMLTVGIAALGLRRRN